MAFYTNNKKADLCGFVKNEEILILDLPFSATEPCLVKCRLTNGTNSTNINDSSGKKNKQESKQTNINSVAISNCGTLLAACTSDNYVHEWKLKENKWDDCSLRPLIRKCQKMLFTNSSSDIIVADRGGDVFRFSAQVCKEPGNFLLGHISLILDIAISSNDKYLATCDRDGKIRVSCYPNCYNIVGYCLGHQEFVSSIQFLELSDEVLLSSSGDGTIRLWQHFENGLEQKSAVLHENSTLCEQCNVSEGKGQVAEQLEPQGTSSGNLVLSEKQIQFSVRCLKYCSKHGMCAVLFHLQSGIAIFKLSQKGDFEFKQFLILPSLPLDAVFCTDGKLLILMKQDVDALACFDYSPKDKMFVEISHEKIPQSVEEFYAEFSSSHAFPDDFVTLFKRSYETPDDDDDCIKRKKN